MGTSVQSEWETVTAWLALMVGLHVVELAFTSS